MSPAHKDPDDPHPKSLNDKSVKYWRDRWRHYQGPLQSGKPRKYDSVVMDRVAVGLPPHENYRPSIWNDLITADKIEVILKKDVVEVYSRAYQDLRRIDAARLPAGQTGEGNAAGAGTGGGAVGRVGVVNDVPIR